MFAWNAFKTSNLILPIVLAVHLPQTKEEIKNLWRQEIQIISTRMILIKLVLNMTWLMVNKKI